MSTFDWVNFCDVFGLYPKDRAPTMILSIANNKEQTNSFSVYFGLRVSPCLPTIQSIRVISGFLLTIIVIVRDELEIIQNPNCFTDVAKVDRRCCTCCIGRKCFKDKLQAYLFKIFHMFQMYVACVLICVLHMFETYVATTFSTCLMFQTNVPIVLHSCCICFQRLCCMYICSEIRTFICFRHIFQLIHLSVVVVDLMGVVQRGRKNEDASHGGVGW